MSERFFVAPPVAGERVELTGDEARHLANVMRAKAGDDVMLFDGSGAEFDARVTSIGPRAVGLTILQRREASRELPFELTLAVALPKGERQKWLVEKATELGVTRFVPLISRRGVAQPTAATIERLRRTVIEASKQCGRNRLMEIAAPTSAEELFAAAGTDFMRFVANPGGEAWPAGLVAGANVIAAIGPEGGFASDELQTARQSGWKLVSLGPRILRVETAALALAAWLVRDR